MIYKVYYIEINGSTEITNFSTKKHAQAFLDRNDIAVESVLKITRKGETDVTHLFDIKYFADSAETDTENSEEYLAEQEKEYLDKLEEDIPEYDPYNVKEYFMGEEHYKGYGFYGEKRLEKFLWRVYDLLRYTPERIDYENTIDLIIKEDKQLSIIDSKYKPFSDTDKKIFNSQILLSRLKGLVIFEMWKQEYPRFN